MVLRFFLYSDSGTCWPVELPGRQASLAPKKTVCTLAVVSEKFGVFIMDYGLWIMDYGVLAVFGGKSGVCIMDYG